MDGERFAPYITLLQKFIAGQVIERDFVRKWSHLIQRDPLPRTEKEMGLLQSLCVDRMGQETLTPDPTAPLLEQQARALLSLLSD